ncbi:GH1 family beta-glucosidase [Microlunatus ginsengisoli]|uniref:Beta-glucosidase n=1 Tax=Microlunatus ginsengisoli TaxID=363863 RepID=A0ABP7A6E1_9ACTN
MTSFPPDFVWGAATASYQIEGAVAEDGRHPSIWDTFAHTAGAILDGTTGDVACDHYHRFAEDIAILADLGLTAYRFSIGWPRVLPDGAGAVNQPGLDFYRRIAETCLEHGVTPWATLYHWDLPQPLEDAGGWLSRDTAGRFADYAATTASALGDVVSHWITLNEPWCSAFLGYAAGVHAPGKSLGVEAAKAAHHLLLGHGEAVQALRAADAEATVGITVNLYSIRAATDSAADREAARRADAQGNRLFLDPVLLGRYPEDAIADLGLQDWFAEHSADLPVISAPIDFMGINYYSRQTFAAPADGVFGTPGVVSAAPGSENLQLVDTGAPTTAMGWEVHPDGLVDVVEMVHQRAPGLPVYITENGAAYEDVVGPDGTVDDSERRLYYELHVDACRLAIERGMALKGYFAWSLLDNFEWAFGFSRRFGIVYVDYDTQQRIVKNSGLWFKEFLAS